MRTDLQSAILAALRANHPEPMTDVQIWAATGGYEYGGHSLSCAIACFELLRQAEIELVEGGKKWKLADTEGAQTEDCASSQGNVGQMVGADRKPLSPTQDAPSARSFGEQPERNGFAPSPAHSGETESCGDNLHAFHSDAVSLATGPSVDCGGVKRISRQAHNLEITGSTPVPATSLDEEESGLSAGATFGTQCEKSCSSVEGHAGMVVNEDQGYLRTTTKAEGGNGAFGKTLSEYQASPTGLKVNDVPQSMQLQGNSNDAAESMQGRAHSIDPCATGPASQLLSPEFHAVHIADEGANSTRAWWGELEREAQEAIEAEMVVSNERWR